jgi:hypothetical protein
MLSLDSLIALIIFCCLAHAGGLLIAKLWGWLQVIAIALIVKGLLGYSLEDMTFALFLEYHKGIEVLGHQDLTFFKEALLYYLKFRDVDAQVLELMLYSFLGGRHYQYILSINEGKESSK